MSLEEARILKIIVGEGLAQIQYIVFSSSIYLQISTLPLSSDLLRINRIT